VHAISEKKDVYGCRPKLKLVLCKADIPHETLNIASVLLSRQLDYLFVEGKGTNGKNNNNNRHIRFSYN
jgi:hypothetical protein